MSNPLAQARQIVIAIARLPCEMREMRGEMDRVLTGAAAYFEHSTALSQCPRKDLQDRAFIALAGFGN